MATAMSAYARMIVNAASTGGILVALVAAIVKDIGGDWSQDYKAFRRTFNDKAKRTLLESAGALEGVTPAQAEAFHNDKCKGKGTIPRSVKAGKLTQAQQRIVNAFGTLEVNLSRCHAVVQALAKMDEDTRAGWVVQIEKGLCTWTELDKLKNKGGTQPTPEALAKRHAKQVDGMDAAERRKYFAAYFDALDQMDATLLPTVWAARESATA